MLAVSISFLVLGSSSSGNASVVLFDTPEGRRAVLLDAGLGPRVVQTQLEKANLGGLKLDAVVLTHSDTDHIRPSWARTLARWRCPVYVPQAHFASAISLGVPRDTARMVGGQFEPFPGVVFAPIVVPHDIHGSCAYRIECGEFALGWATDLGRVTDELLEHFRSIDALAIESNYDPDMQERSDRPYFLKQRITNGHGHLSNAQCLAAVRALDAERRLEHIELLHLSQECNCPTLLRSFWANEAPEFIERMAIARPRGPEPLRHLRSATANQYTSATPELFA